MKMDASARTWNYTDTLQYLERVRTGFPPMMICVAVNGGVQGKEYNSALPETPDEIATSTYEAYQAGATMVHVHARDPNDLTIGARSTADWVTVIESIRRLCPDIIINATTGGDLSMSMEERLCCLDARPDIATLNLSPEMSRFRLKPRPENFPNPRPALEIDACLPFTYGQIEHYAREIQARGIRPELEIYHTGGSQVLRGLIAAGLVTPPYLVQTVMGTQTASYPTPENMLHLVRELPGESVWLASGIGPHQLPMTVTGMLMGAHVRVGLEDNVYYRRGQLMKSNAQAVERMVRLANELGRPVATAAEARALLGLAPFGASA